MGPIIFKITDSTFNNVIVKKIIAISHHLLKIKCIKDGKTLVISADLRNAIQDIMYWIDDFSDNNPVLVGIEKSKNEISIYIATDVSLSGGEISVFSELNEENTGIQYLYLASGETATDEPATETILFPPPEMVEQFMERVWARLLHLTRRIRILRHEEPHQNALSEKICREVPENHDEVLRYDIACNLIKRPCGWLALQLENYQARYNRHLAAVVKAKEAGTTPPTFNRGSDETKIEAMLEKLEGNLTEECLQEHFDMHDHGEWDKIQNKQRKITLCDDDYSPGEVLVDVNSFFTDGNGNIAETHAKKTYHDISTKYWVMAKRTAHRNLVTERTVEL